MAAPMDTALGGEEGSNPPKLSLKQIIQKEFKDDKVSNGIYSQLVEMEIVDIQTLVLTDDDDLNDLCKDMNLKGAKKIKFKALIRKQKQLYQSKQPQQPQHIVTISKKEQAEIDQIDLALKQADSIHHLFEEHFNEIEQHTETTKLVLNQQFDSIFKALQARQKIIANKIDEWKLNKLESVNKETSNIIAYNEELKRIKKEIYGLLSKDRSVMQQREKNIQQITHQLCEQNQYYKTFNDTKLYQQYINNNTELMGLSFQETMSMNKLDEYGKVKVNELNEKYKVPSIVLSDIEKTKESVKGCNIKMKWKMVSNQQNMDNDDKKANYNSQFVVKYMKYDAENTDNDEKKELDTTNDKAEWDILNDIKIRSQGNNIFGTDVTNYFGYGQLYRFKIQTMIEKPIQTTISSNIKEIVTILNLDIQQIKQIPLKIHSTVGPMNGYKPQNVLESNNEHFCSKFGVVRDAWIIFDIDSKAKDNSCYYPVNIKLRAYHANNSMKNFEVYIGSVQKNEWTKLHENVFTALKNKDKWQEFSLEITRNNNVSTEWNRKWLRIRDNKYTQLKLLIKNNHGHGTNVKITEFQIFGVRT